MSDKKFHLLSYSEKLERMTVDLHNLAEKNILTKDNLFILYFECGYLAGQYPESVYKDFDDVIVQILEKQFNLKKEEKNWNDWYCERHNNIIQISHEGMSEIRKVASFLFLTSQI